MVGLFTSDSKENP